MAKVQKMPYFCDPVWLTKKLVRFSTPTPARGAIFVFLQEVLHGLGFRTELIVGGEGEFRVENLYARRGQGRGPLVFAGHVDVVPAGDEGAWSSPPFGACERDGKLYGRGVVDMKGGVASFLAALGRAASRREGAPEDIALVITGDEEGPALHGTKLIVDAMEARGEVPMLTIIGEPTSVSRVGDSIKYGRRGSLSFTLEVIGKQGHVAYPSDANNPVRGLVLLLDKLSGPLDEGTESFSPSWLEFIDVGSDNEVWNVIPQRVRARGNLRHGDSRSQEGFAALIRERADGLLSGSGLRADFTFLPSVSPPFASPLNAAVERVVVAMERVTGMRPRLSTSGGTSDGRFLKRLGAVIEVGDVGTSMHRVNENTPTENLEQLTNIYAAILDEFAKE